jgi:hypothetical protein
MKTTDQIYCYINELPRREFHDGFYDSMAWQDTIKKCAQNGAESLSEKDLRGLHEFLVMHGVPLSHRRFQAIDTSEVEFACKTMLERAKG